MRTRRPLFTLGALLAGATLLASCSKQSEPTASGPAPAVEVAATAAATATETPTPGPTTPTPEELHAQLVQALLQPSDLGGDGWKVEEIGAADTAAFLRDAPPQFFLFSPALLAACLPDLRLSTNTTPTDAMTRLFTHQSHPARTISMILRTPEAQSQMKSNQILDGSDAWNTSTPCLAREYQKAIQAAYPGIEVQVLVFGASHTADRPPSRQAVVRWLAANRPFLRVASVMVAEGDVLATATVALSSEGVMLQALPQATIDDLAALTAKRLAEALR